MRNQKGGKKQGHSGGHSQEQHSEEDRCTVELITQSKIESEVRLEGLWRTNGARKSFFVSRAVRDLDADLCRPWTERLGQASSRVPAQVHPINLMLNSIRSSSTVCR